MKKPFLICAAVIAFASAGLCAAVPAAHAATSAGFKSSAAASDCVITDSDIAAVKAAAAEGLTQELAARKSLLARVLNCAITDVKSLQSELNGMQVPDGAQNIQSQLSGQFDSALNFYNIELGKVNDAGVYGTQEIAKDVLDWRSSNYAPIQSQVNNFSLWVSNQPLFEAANDRLKSIESLVGYLEEAGQNNNLQSNLSEAQSLMKSANDDNSVAENAFVQNMDPGTTLSLVKNSLDALSAVYQKFFDISTVVGNLLPADGKSK